MSRSSSHSDRGAGHIWLEFGVHACLPPVLRPNSGAQKNSHWRDFANPNDYTQRIENTVATTVFCWGLQPPLGRHAEGLAIWRGLFLQIARRGLHACLLKPALQRSTNLMRTVFLQKMQPFYCHFALVFPATAEITLRADQYRAGVGIYKQFRYVALRHETGIIFSNGDNIGRLTGNRDLPRPAQSRPPVFRPARQTARDKSPFPLQ